MNAVSALVALLGACSDYDVARSDLNDASESEEIVLDDGGSVTLVIRAEADGEAMGANPTAYAKATVFAVTESGSPRVSMTMGPESTDAGLAPTAFLELQLDDPFAGCGGETIPGGPEVTSLPDGGCAVEIPVALGATGGGVSLQLDAYVQLNFARRDPPGTLEVSVSVAD